MGEEHSKGAEAPDKWQLPTLLCRKLNTAPSPNEQAERAPVTMRQCH